MRESLKRELDLLGTNNQQDFNNIQEEIKANTQWLCELEADIPQTTLNEYIATFSRKQERISDLLKDLKSSHERYLSILNALQNFEGKNPLIVPVQTEPLSDFAAGLEIKVLEKDYDSFVKNGETFEKFYVIIQELQGSDSSEKISIKKLLKNLSNLPVTNWTYLETQKSDLSKILKTQLENPLRSIQFDHQENLKKLNTNLQNQAILFAQLEGQPSDIIPNSEQLLAQNNTYYKDFNSQINLMRTHKENYKTIFENFSGQGSSSPSSGSSSLPEELISEKDITTLFNMTNNLYLKMQMLIIKEQITVDNIDKKPLSIKSVITQLLSLDLSTDLKTERLQILHTFFVACENEIKNFQKQSSSLREELEQVKLKQDDLISRLDQLKQSQETLSLLETSINSDDLSDLINLNTLSDLMAKIKRCNKNHQNLLNFLTPTIKDFNLKVSTTDQYHLSKDFDNFTLNNDELTTLESNLISKHANHEKSLSDCKKVFTMRAAFKKRFSKTDNSHTQTNVNNLEFYIPSSLKEFSPLKSSTGLIAQRVIDELCEPSLNNLDSMIQSPVNTIRDKIIDFKNIHTKILDSLDTPTIHDNLIKAIRFNKPPIRALEYKKHRAAKNLQDLSSFLQTLNPKRTWKTRSSYCDAFKEILMYSSHEAKTYRSYSKKEFLTVHDFMELVENALPSINALDLQIKTKISFLEKNFGILSEIFETVKKNFNIVTEEKTEADRKSNLLMYSKKTPSFSDLLTSHLLLDTDPLLEKYTNTFEKFYLFYLKKAFRYSLQEYALTFETFQEKQKDFYILCDRNLEMLERSDFDINNTLEQLSQDHDEIKELIKKLKAYKLNQRQAFNDYIFLRKNILSETNPKESASFLFMNAILNADTESFITEKEEKTFMDEIRKDILFLEATSFQIQDKINTLRNHKKVTHSS